MRYLHAVGIHEKFVASGLYGSEEWTIHELPDGPQLIRADFDGRETKEKSVLVEALINPHTLNFERIDTHVYLDDGRLFKDSYTFFDGYIQNAFSFHKGERQYNEIPLEQGHLFAPPSHILSGFFIARLAQNMDVKQICLFSIGDDDLKSIKQHPCRVSLIDQAQIDDQTATAYRYSGLTGQSTVWLDQHHIKLQDDTVSLTRYARRKDT